MTHARRRATSEETTGAGGFPRHRPAGTRAHCKQTSAPLLALIAIQRIPGIKFSLLVGTRVSKVRKIQLLILGH